MPAPKKTSGAVSVESAREQLKAAALRCTPSRIAILRLLSQSDQPLSHSDVAERLRESGFDPSTAYRALIELADTGLLIRLDIGDQIRRYEFKHVTPKTATTGKRAHDDREHPHFVCLDCGHVTCLTDVTVQLPKSRAVGKVTEILLRGHCVNCL